MAQGSGTTFSPESPQTVLSSRSDLQAAGRSAQSNFGNYKVLSAHLGEKATDKTGISVSAKTLGLCLKEIKCFQITKLISLPCVFPVP